jgi:hypothetical protein
MGTGRKPHNDALEESLARCFASGRPDKLGLSAQSSNISSITILNMLLQGTKPPRRQLKQDDRPFPPQRIENRFLAPYIPKDTSFTSACA